MRKKQIRSRKPIQTTPAEHAELVQLAQVLSEQEGRPVTLRETVVRGWRKLAEETAQLATR